LNDRCKSLKGSKILALGVAYKRDVDDVRESPSIDVMTLLLDKGAVVEYADPFVPSVVVAGREFRAVALDKNKVAAADVVIMLTDHTAFDRKMIAAAAGLIVDTRNGFRAIHSDHIVRI
jgi:UDP-N-acetyl-D-glucosamine dehydrogenase